MRKRHVSILHRLHAALPESADVAGAHLVAGYGAPRRSAHGGLVILAAIMLKRAGLVSAFFPAHHTDASRELEGCHFDVADAVVYIGFVALVCRGYEKADCLFVHCAHGFGPWVVSRLETSCAPPDSVKGAVMGPMARCAAKDLAWPVSCAMFLCVGVMYDRGNSRDEISAYGGRESTRCRLCGFSCVVLDGE